MGLLSFFKRAKDKTTIMKKTINLIRFNVIINNYFINNGRLLIR